MPLHYPGDHTAQYDPETGSGLIGRVLGPDYDGERLIVTDAVFDPETNMTTADVAMVGGLPQ